MNKENEVGPYNAIHTNGSSKLEKASKEVEACGDAPPPPSTPATRLPLAELVGNCDFNKVDQTLLSPDDRLVWNQPLSPRNSQVSITPASRRGKKRARSSSPVSSLTPEESLSKTKKINSGKSQHTLRTPQADPAAGLWNRYTTSTQSKDEESTTKKTVSFAHLINESSPHSSATASNVSGLRRWTSCGLEWPTSNAKRKRTTGRFNATAEQAHVDNRPDSQKSGTSKAQKLLQQIQKTLSKPEIPITEMPSSSSPLPDRVGFHQQVEISPLQQRERVQTQLTRPIEPVTSSQSLSDHDNDPSASPQSSSDYGSEDFDVDMVEAIEATQSLSHETPSKIRHSNKTASQSLPPALIQQENHVPVALKETAADEALSMMDDFDFEDDDILAADLEDVAAKYDIAHDEDIIPHNTHSTTPADNPVLQNATTKEVESEDDFGGLDVDDNLFDAIQQHATQACQSGNVQPSVRVWQ
jgi:DNA replication ATP-dependent helicase Dna2